MTEEEKRLEIYRALFQLYYKLGDDTTLGEFDGLVREELQRVTHQLPTTVRSRGQMNTQGERCNMAKEIRTHQDILALPEIKALRKGLQQARKIAKDEARRAAGNLRVSQRSAAKNPAYDYKVDLALQEQEDADALRALVGRLEREYYTRINQLCKQHDLPAFFFEGTEMATPGY